jgi:hypothetical protein
VWKFAQRTFYIGPLRVELICQEVLKSVWPSMNRISCSLFTFRPPLSMHHHKRKDLIDVKWALMKNHRELTSDEKCCEVKA